MPKTSRIAALADFDRDYLDGRSFVLGIDEAGRGALAGPVCAGAVAVSAKLYDSPEALSMLSALNDSKQISHEARESLFSELEKLKKAQMLDFEAGFADVSEIESQNILVATQIAMARAAEAVNLRQNLNLRRAGAAATLFGESRLDVAKAQVLIDGKEMKKFPYSHKAVVKGDAQSLAIAAASIVAKVSRDRLMDKLAEKYPRFGFEHHKGYGTAAHMQALVLFGTTPEHRKSFLKKIRPEENDSPKETQQTLF